MSEKRNWKNIATELYKILDNIDTLDDATKEDDKMFRRFAVSQTQARFKYHKLFDPEGDVSKFNQPSKG